MPVYEYLCEPCEFYFTELKKVSEYNQPVRCPRCNSQADKIISAPRLNVMRGDMRKAHETNERSADSPKVHRKHECGSHCHHHHKTETKPPEFKQQVNRRPWMLGH